MKLKGLVICFLFFSFSVFAQEKTRISTIRGRVTSSGECPVEFGSVFVLTTDTSVVTQALLFDGLFELDSVPFGNYFLVIRASNLQDLNMNLNVADSLFIFDSMRMRQIQALDEVTVGAERPKLTFDVGKDDVQVKGQPYFEGQKALEMIAKLPGVIVDNTTIYMNTYF